MKINQEDMLENFPQVGDTFVERLQRPFSNLLAEGCVQFKYYDGVIFAVDQGGFILSRQTYEEITEHWAKFYDTFSDDDIDWINENKHLYRRPIPTMERKSASIKRRGIIYILHGGGYYKIGKTTNINARLAQLTPKLPFDVELIHTIKTEDIDGLEEFLHYQYANKRSNGEWFKLDDTDVEVLKQMPQ